MSLVVCTRSTGRLVEGARYVAVLRDGLWEMYRAGKVNGRLCVRPACAERLADAVFGNCCRKIEGVTP